MTTPSVPLEAVPDPALVVECDAGQGASAATITAVNQAGAERWDDVTGQSLATILADDEAVGDLLTGAAGQAWAHERRLRDVDGGPWPAELTVRRLDEDRSLVVVRDVGRRRELEREGEMLEALLEHVPVSVYFKDRQSRHVAVSDAIVDRPVVNEEGKVHPAPEDVIGKTDLDLYPAQVAEPAMRDDRKVIEEGTTIENREERVDWPNGQTGWHTTAKVPWYDTDGAIQGIVGVTVDVTDRKRYEQELKRQNERLEEFASVVSHDLRNPLEVARGALELYREDGRSAELDRVERMHERMDRLIEDTLALARSGQRVTEPESVALGDVATDAWSGVDTATASLSVESSRTVRADGDRLRRLFENLFRNSIEHAGPDAAVTVGDLQAAAGFFVADDGPGIPPDEREDVFGHGYSTSDGGTGFGLSIVSEIAAAHGWDVTVTESEDGGARFEFRFHGSRTDATGGE